MKVKITHTMARNHYYSSSTNCPLAAALKKIGFTDVWVGGDHFLIKDKQYYFDSHGEKPTGWDMRKYLWCISRRRSFMLDIPGLELPEKAGETHVS